MCSSNARLISAAGIFRELLREIQAVFEPLSKTFVAAAKSALYRFHHPSQNQIGEEIVVPCDFTPGYANWSGAPTCIRT